MKQVAITISCLIFSLCLAFSQSEAVGDQVEITTSDGASIIGSILEMTDQYIIIYSTSLGETTIAKEHIEQIKKIRSDASLEVDHKGYDIDFHGSTHYLVNQSAFSLKKGQSYYENIWVLWNSASFGISDHFSISVGGEIASLLFAGRFPILFVSPKLSTASPGKINGAISTTFFSSPADDFVGFGVVQGLFTYGDRNNNLTFGTGFGFSTDGVDANVVPLSLSFMTRISKRLSLVSENFLITYDGFDGSFGTLSLALRIHGKKRGVSITAGLFRPLADTDALIAFPFISGTIPF